MFRRRPISRLSAKRCKNSAGTMAAASVSTNRGPDPPPPRIRPDAKELVGLNPDAILVSTALALQPMQQETRSIPIVFTRVVDPVEAGFVASLARPGGNITGFTPAESSVFGKLLDVFKELAPRITRVAVIFNPDQAPQSGPILRAIETAAPSVMMQVTPAPARDAV